MIDSGEPAKPSSSEKEIQNSDYIYLPRLELGTGMRDDPSFPNVINHIRQEIKDQKPQETTFHLVDDHRFRIKKNVLEAIYQRDVNPINSKENGADVIPSNLLVYGESKFSTVVLGEDILLERPVVLKFLKTVERELENASEEFYKEARVIANLEHPHIVKIYDLTLVPYKDFHFPVMILKKYEHSLKQMMESNTPLTIEQIIKLSSQIGSALDYIHEKGVVNCDVKPENILFDKDGNAFLTDFGIASGDYRPANWQNKYQHFTPGWVAPEILNDGKPTIHSDQYTLALTIHMLLGGKRDKENQFIILSFADEKFMEVYNVLKKATSAVPEYRYANCNEFFLELKKALDTLPPETKVVFNKDVPDFKTNPGEKS